MPQIYMLTYSGSLQKIYSCISVFMHNITLTKKGIRLFSCLIRYHVGLHMLPVQMLTVRGFSIQYNNYVTFTYLVYLWDIQKPCTYILTYVDLCKYFSKMLTNLNLTNLVSDAYCTRNIPGIIFYLSDYLNPECLFPPLSFC